MKSQNYGFLVNNNETSENKKDFFFQAEDGIRDFCMSRGLGDVYRSQVCVCVCVCACVCECVCVCVGVCVVAYTHLTLPTINSVYISVLGIPIE